MTIERLPLNALRAFAEAARAGSFQAAAGRLGVTAGAVSRHVKQLEERLGTPLFDRHPNGVSVNMAGRRLMGDVDAGLQRIADGVEAVSRQPVTATTLLISAPTSFAQLWLLPRLAAFEAGEREVEISLDATQTLTVPHWNEDGARLALRNGRGPWPGVRSVRLFEDAMYPVCAPALLERAPIEQPADLLNHRLLEVAWSSRPSGDLVGWRAWFEAAGLSATDLPRRRRYSLYNLALDQALAGAGIVLASHPVVADRLASGVLVRPFGERHILKSPLTYDLILPATGDAPPAVQRFVDWLIAEAGRYRQAAGIVE